MLRYTRRQSLCVSHFPKHREYTSEIRDSYLLIILSMETQEIVYGLVIECFSKPIGFRSQRLFYIYFRKYVPLRLGQTFLVGCSLRSFLLLRYPFFLLRQMLVPDPTFRPRVSQLHEHLVEISVLNGWNLEEKIDFGRVANKNSSPAHGSLPQGMGNQPTYLHNLYFK